MAPTSTRPMTSALDAIEVVLTLLDAEPDTTLAALVDRLPEGGRAVIHIDGGPSGPEGVTPLAELLAGGLAEEVGSRVVLVSVRPGPGDAVAEADLAVWRALVRRARAWPFVLLDWLVVTDEAIVSLAEVAGPPARWDG